MSNQSYQSKKSSSSKQPMPTRQLKSGTILKDNRPQGKTMQTLNSTREASIQRQQASPEPNRTGLPDHLKSGVEALSGMSMDHVKVHYNSQRPAQLNAHAYAQGSDIHLATGQEKHLPHEAWHVVQQAQGRVKPTVQQAHGVPINDDSGLEREADSLGARAETQGLRGNTNAATIPAQRMATTEGVAQLGKKGRNKDKGGTLKVGGKKSQRQRNVGRLGSDEGFTAWYHNAKQKGQISNLLGVEISGGRDSIDSKQAKLLWEYYQTNILKKSVEESNEEELRDETESGSDSSSESEEEQDPSERIKELRDQLQNFKGPRSGKKWENFSGSRLEEIEELEKQI